MSLIERLEQVEGPSRELDAEIAVAVLGMERDGNVFFGKSENYLLERDYYSLDGGWRELPYYTSSIDAALTLVPEGFRNHILLGISPMSIDIGGKNWRCQVGKQRVAARLPALALCIAALRAQGGNHD